MGCTLCWVGPEILNSRDSLCTEPKRRPRAFCGFTYTYAAHPATGESGDPSRAEGATTP